MGAEEEVLVIIMFLHYAHASEVMPAQDQTKAGDIS